MQVQRIPGERVTLHSAATTLPAPTTSSDGGDLVTWREEHYPLAALQIEKASGAGDVTIASPELVAYDATSGLWISLGSLNGGSTITVKSAKGFAQQLGPVGVYGRLAVVGTVSGGGVNAYLDPMDYEE